MSMELLDEWLWYLIFIPLAIRRFKKISLR